MEYNQNNVRLVQTDCLALLETLPDNSVDLIATDPPYYKVKTDQWDRQWNTKQAFLCWLNEVMLEYKRILKPGGSLYLFCSPYLDAETELLIDKHLKVLNHIVWRKPSGRWNGCNKESLTKYFPQTERVIFAESRKKHPFPYEPIRSHLADSLKNAGITAAEINRLTGTKMSNHWLGRSQFSLPSEKHYNLLQSLAPNLKLYPEIRAEYVALRKATTRTGRHFHVTKHVPYTDVWDFPAVHPYKGKHPCEKPIALMEHIIQSSSAPGDTILDTFAGSGTTAIATQNLDRKFIGSEMGEAEFKQAVERIEKAQKEMEERTAREG